MISDIPKQYSSKEVEGKWYAFWNEKGFFHTDASRGGKPYCIVIPPPNVTGILHMGHALNNTIQDILIRYKRMKGENALWIPGTDHAGIATQNVVEKMLAKENTDRKELGREKFLERVWRWKDEYGNTIVNQLKRLGCSCDWDRLRFTMDEGLSRAVLEVFVRLYEKGLIYQGDYIVNWCPRCQTALSDEEVIHKDVLGRLYHIAYPIKDSRETVVVATTRPETLLGDVAVAVNPKDARYRGLESKILLLPVLNRELKVILDDFVDPEFGTGVVKVTPAHDPNDFLMGQRHALTPVNVMTGDARMNESAGEDYCGMDRFECREALLEDLDERGLLKKVVEHQHSVGHCYRCHTVIEPRLSRQWFVKMKPLAEEAIRAVEKGRIKFFPRRWTKVYLAWMKNIRDWCISRQIWWGHRIPVWYCVGGDRCTLRCKEPVVARTAPERCPHCGSTNLRQDEDVLDTWFSSWLWPFSTLNWPDADPDRPFYYPTSVLVTAQEIIFFWVARMIMSGYEFMGERPFSHVYIHGTVRDETGAKMSKSLGNIIDPIEIIEEFGTDALRMSIIMLTAQGQDVFLSRPKFEMGRNFANKIWNASRFLLMNLDGSAATPLDRMPADLSTDDRYILSRLQQLTAVVTRSLEAYRFNDAAHEIYEFFWHHFCDRYIESVKAVFQGEDSPRKLRTQRVLLTVLETCLRLLHPVMPFITEEIWQILKAGGFLRTGVDSIMAAPWPASKRAWMDQDADREAEIKYDLVRVGRNLRAEYQVKPGQEMRFLVKPGSPGAETLILAHREEIRMLLKASEFKVDSAYSPDRAMPSGSCAAGVIYMDLVGVFDYGAERLRLTKQLDQMEAQIHRIEARLEKQEFLTKAPQEVIERERVKMQDLRKEREKLQKNLDFIRSVNQ